VKRLALSIGLGLLSACSADPARLDGPTQAIVARDGRVYVADGYFNARIAVFGKDGRFLNEWGSKGFEHGQLQTPHALVEALDGTLVVADRDNGRLQRFTTGGRFVASLRSDELGRPWGVSVAPGGHLFVADGGDQTEVERAFVVELAVEGTVVRRFGGFGAAAGQLDEPHMLAVAPDREVFVVELGNRRVQRFAPRAGCDPDDVQCEYEAVAGWPMLEATPGLEPLSIALDGDRVYVGHQGDPASIWVLDRTSGVRTDVLAEGAFERPHGLFVESDGTIWVSDDRGDRIVHLGADGRLLGTLGTP
jgi:DNA-binding beta-propeller fold protein YncE